VVPDRERARSVLGRVSRNAGESGGQVASRKGTLEAKKDEGSKRNNSGQEVKRTSLGMRKDDYEYRCRCIERMMEEEEQNRPESRLSRAWSAVSFRCWDKCKQVQVQRRDVAVVLTLLERSGRLSNQDGLYGACRRCRRCRQCRTSWER
jgi:hypothetical protein